LSRKASHSGLDDICCCNLWRLGPRCRAASKSISFVFFGSCLMRLEAAFSKLGKSKSVRTARVFLSFSFHRYPTDISSINIRDADHPRQCAYVHVLGALRRIEVQSIQYMPSNPYTPSLAKERMTTIELVNLSSGIQYSVPLYLSPHQFFSGR
jgi:hypothetical protein